MDVTAAQRLVERAHTVDVVVGAGDFANARQGLHQCIRVLSSIEQPTVLVAGNNESTEELMAACQNWPQAHVLHGSGVTINGVEFFGLGGGIPVTPFGSWSYDFTEEQAAQLLTHCPAECVLVTHSPPHGAVDKSSRGQRLGSTVVRETVLRQRPKLVVCGHIHGSAGQQASLGPSPVVNAGPDGIEWVLP